MKTITLSNEKGGVGKTTLSTYIAVYLALVGYRVLFLDTEQQKNAAQAFGFSPEPDFYNLMVRNAPWSDCIRKIPDAIIGAPGKHLYTVLGNSETRFVNSIDDISTRILERLMEVGDLFDFCVIDSSPTLSELHKGIFLASNHILIPTDLEPFSVLDGIPDTQIHTSNVAKIASAAGLNTSKVLGIIPNNYKYTKLHDRFYALLEAQYPDLVWQPIPSYTAIPESQLKQRFLFTDAPDLKATHAMTQVCERLLAEIANIATEAAS